MRGAQQSLMVMVIAGVVATIIGVVIGAIAGYYRKATDSVLMRFTDVIITIPLIVIGAVLGKTFGSLGAAVLGVVIGIFAWTTMARLVRGEFLTLREREFVDAARVSGARDRRIIFRHILPNAVGVIVVNATLLMAGAILLESALSYLGFGVQPPDTSLGKIVSDNQAAFSTRPWVFWWPGIFIIAIALCVNFIGDGLRDAFDPRQKKMPSERAMRRAGRRGGPVVPILDRTEPKEASHGDGCDGGRVHGRRRQLSRPATRGAGRRAERAPQPGAVIVTLLDQQTDHRGRGQRRDHGDRSRSATSPSNASGSSPLAKAPESRRRSQWPRIACARFPDGVLSASLGRRLPCSPRALWPIPSKSLRASPNARWRPGAGVAQTGTFPRDVWIVSE